MTQRSPLREEFIETVSKLSGYRVECVRTVLKTMTTKYIIDHWPVLDAIMLVKRWIVKNKA